MPPGPPGHLLLGSLREVQREPLGTLLDGYRRYGDIVRYRFAFTRAYLLTHPDHIQHVLHDNHRNYDKNNMDYAMLRRLLGNGLLTSEGTFWYRQRRLMAPMFHRERVARFGKLMTDATTAMLEGWRTRAEEAQPFDIAAEMTRLTLTIVAKALFSTNVSEDAESIGKGLTLANRQMAEFRLLDLIPGVPTLRKLRFNSAVRNLDQVVRKIVGARRSAEERDAQGGDDLLSMLLTARDKDTGERMDERQIRDEVITLLLAGHETTANALAWTWYLLSQNPEAEAKLHDELRRVLGGRTAAVEDLAQLNFTRMVIEESMRLYPPAWAISRNAIQDDEIGGYHVPARTTVVMSTFITQRHPMFWEEPDRFDPERFTPERSRERPIFAYFPFGGGPRICIGNNFAMLEAQLVLATVAQRYSLRLAPGHPVELEPLITLRPRHGIRVTAHPVTATAARSEAASPI